MTKERWVEIKAQIRQNFGIEDEYTEDLDPGIAEIVEFNGPQGSMQVQFITKPKMLDKKTTYSNRPGSDIRVDYVFSDKESVSHLKAYVWSEEKDDWQKLDTEALF